VNSFLVTGAGGFVGRALVARLRAAGHKVLALTSQDGDIAEPDTFGRLGEREFDRVFHLAARTFVPDSWSDPASFYRSNVLGTANVIQACKSSGAALTFVSAYLYGEPGSLPIGEDSPIRPNNPYALSKLLAEELCEFHSLRDAIPTTVVRPFNVYGHGQRESFLIPSIIAQVLAGGEVRVNDLSPKRDYVYIDDVTDALERTAAQSAGYAVYNIGSGGSISVKQLIDTVQAIAGHDGPVVSRQISRQNEIQDVVADIARARRELGWAPKVSFAEGVRRMLSLAGGGY
jgi:GDP-4-dehydro-6-deoxy-D-mannose reductase